LKIGMSEKWRPEDKNVILTHNFTDIRAEINVKKSGWRTDKLI